MFFELHCTPSTASFCGDDCVVLATPAMLPLLGALAGTTTYALTQITATAQPRWYHGLAGNSTVAAARNLQRHTLAAYSGDDCVACRAAPTRRCARMDRGTSTRPWVPRSGLKVTKAVPFLPEKAR